MRINTSKYWGGCYKEAFCCFCHYVLVDDGEEKRTGYGIVVKVEADSIRNLDEVELKTQ
jgi:hypothetical protein